MENKINCILLIGVAGGLAQITVKLLRKKHPDTKIVGVDTREIDNSNPIENSHFFKIKYSKGSFEKLFREYKFDYVYHLGRISHAISDPQYDLAKRLDLNIVGTKNILNLCLQHSVKKIILLSTYHVYGALSDNPIFIGEEASLRASIERPELRDVVEMDQLSTNWMWKNQNKIETIVLRPCNIVGAQIRNAISLYLTSSFSPTPIDYKPMLQFIHEFDMANILLHCIDKVPTGIYNVAPDEFISLQDARTVVGIKGVRTSIFVVSGLARFIKKAFTSVPDYLLEYLKFSCLIDGSQLTKILGKDCYRFSLKETLELLQLS